MLDLSIDSANLSYSKIIINKEFMSATRFEEKMEDEYQPGYRGRLFKPSAAWFEESRDLTLPNLVLRHKMPTFNGFLKILLVGAAESEKDGFASYVSWLSKKIDPQNDNFGINIVYLKLHDGGYQFWNIPGKTQYQYLIPQYLSSTDVVFFFGSKPNEFFASFLKSLNTENFESQVITRNAELKPYKVENWSELPKDVVLKSSEFHLEKLLSQLLPEQKSELKKKF